MTINGLSRYRRAALALALAAAASLPAARALCAEKQAVLVLATVEKDAELADNLTELIIARVAQRGGTDIAGKEEFRARLGVENERRAQACLDDIACLGRAAVSLGVRRIVAGTVGTRGKQFLFNLNLNNVEQGKVESRVFRLVEGGVEDLIRAVQEASGELFRPHVEPGKIQAVINAVVIRIISEERVMPCFELSTEHQIHFQMEMRSFPVYSDPGVTHDGDRLAARH